MNIPQHYIPKVLSPRDKKTQKAHIKKLKKSYRRNRYLNRPKLKSFKSKESPHIIRAKKMYKVRVIKPSKELARKTKCSLGTLRKIAKKGKGAYYSSGSRPNQTAHSWARARLASAVSGGNASISDFHLLSKGCTPKSKALRLARKTCKKQNKKCVQKHI
jgi:hypothetical protein